MHKSEFLHKDKGLTHNYEYKFKYDRAEYFISMLNSSSKLELESECVPKVQTSASILRV